MPIPFHIDSNKINSNTFFTATRIDVNNPNRRVSGIVNPVPAIELAAINTTFIDIEMHRQQVLNPMSHAPVVPLTAIEIQAAIHVVDTLIIQMGQIPQ